MIGLLFIGLMIGLIVGGIVTIIEMVLFPFGIAPYYSYKHNEMLQGFAATGRQYRVVTTKEYKSNSSDDPEFSLGKNYLHQMRIEQIRVENMKHKKKGGLTAR